MSPDHRWRQCQSLSHSSVSSFSFSSSSPRSSSSSAKSSLNAAALAPKNLLQQTMTDAKRSSLSSQPRTATRSSSSSSSSSSSASYLIPHIKPDHKILDVGSGPGSTALELARLVPKGSVTGIDVNPAFVTSARGLAAMQRVKNVRFLADVDIMQKTEFGDGEFDVIHAHQAIAHVPDPVAAMREIYRLLKPGGVFATRDVIDIKAFPMSEEIATSLEVWRHSSSERGADPEAGLKTHAWAAQVGFKLYRMEKLALGWQMDKVEERRLWAERVGRSWTEKGNEDNTEMAWEEWAEQDESWVMGVDGCLLAWK